MTGHYNYSFFQWDVILEMITVEMMLSFSRNQGTSIFFNLTNQRGQDQRVSGLEGTKNFMHTLSDRELTASRLTFHPWSILKFISYVDDIYHGWHFGGKY